ncbi:helix-turn-helix domain-containing protein [Zoogloea sp. LCSB751]|uniref:helix-turn-helix domain-containing protein n=1 Tax=Zoogloea sp. LCSB751 TaxID=1965277 RepID=UPI0009A52403|nr:helix-turn-helix transcriptional regulator [Zoogloea sp. LCSB751]
MNRIEALGAVIRDTRMKMNISQEKLAEAAKIHRNGLGRIERGEVEATVGTLCLIADALNVAVSELMQRAEILAESQT